MKNNDPFHLKSVQYRKDILFLINKRIDHIQKVLKMLTAKESLLKRECQQSKTNVPVDLIPFVLLHIFQNADIFSVCRQGEKKVNGRRNSRSAVAIIKQANYCAKRFIKESEQINNTKFVRYCSRKLRKLLMKTSMADVGTNDSLTNILDVYDKLYNTDGMVYDEEERTNKYNQDINNQSDQVHLSKPIESDKVEEHVQDNENQWDSNRKQDEAVFQNN